MIRLALLAALLVAPLAAAGSADAPEVTDAAGDAGPNGAALPGGMEDYDILAAWWENEDADSIDLIIQTSGANRNPPNSDWSQVFDVNGTSYVAGFINFPGPLGYVGPYVCELASVPNSCISTEGGIQGNLIRSVVPRANISSPAAGATIAITGGASGVIVGTQFVVMDSTPAGLPYVATKGALRVNATGDGVAAGPVNVDTGDRSSVRSSAESNSSTTSTETPWPGALAALAAAGAVALARRRRA